jgi:hypothetical protein
MPNASSEKPSLCPYRIHPHRLLLSSTITCARNRIIGGFSEIMSDGTYTYQDFLQKLQLKGKVTSIWNITSESYQYNKDYLFGATFSERSLTVHYAPTKAKKEEWVSHQEKAEKMQLGQQRVLPIY